MIMYVGTNRYTYEPYLVIKNKYRSVIITYDMIVRDFLAGKQRPWMNKLRRIGEK
jgi:hypothetical protein